MRYAIGVDIGGSHISCAVINLDTREILRETVVGRPVDNKAIAELIIETWAEAIMDSLSGIDLNDLAGIGFAMPGPFDYENGICLIKGVPKYEKLYGTDVGNAIKRKLSLPGNIPVRFMNDASSFAVGEAWAGKAAAFDRLMAITLGTGFGSAFISNRVPVVTGDTVPHLGCVYHIPYREGIADDYFSTRWFTSSYFELKGREAGGVLELTEIADGDPEVRSLFKEFGENLGSFLAPWLLKFGAGALVIGGNISRSFNLFGESFKGSLSDNGCKIDIFPSELMEDAALLGSAYLIDDEFWLKVRDSLKFM
jgi:glucokinase